MISSDSASFKSKGALHVSKYNKINNKFIRKEKLNIKAHSSFNTNKKEKLKEPKYIIISKVNNAKISSTENNIIILRIEEKNEYLFLFTNPVKIIKNSNTKDNKFKYNRLCSSSKKIKFLVHKVFTQNK